MFNIYFFFFFQAEDGIRDFHVTGVQTCALPIFSYDYAAIAASTSPEQISAGPPTLWRYRAFLPVDSERVVDTHTGWTPLVRAENLGRVLGLRDLWIKNDTVNPTFSFKDRPVSIASSKALEFGFDT